VTYLLTLSHLLLCRKRALLHFISLLMLPRRLSLHFPAFPLQLPLSRWIHPLAMFPGHSHTILLSIIIRLAP
ncbi:hypothetical protein DFH09DRAFT_1196325, partial [Mycena vulgaris]